MLKKNAQKGISAVQRRRWWEKNRKTIGVVMLVLSVALMCLAEFTLLPFEGFSKNTRDALHAFWWLSLWAPICSVWLLIPGRFPRFRHIVGGFAVVFAAFFFGGAFLVIFFEWLPQLFA